MSKIWKSKLRKELKIRFFRSTVEGVLLYGAEGWTLTKELERRLDGTNTKIIRAILCITCIERMTNDELYGDLEKITEVLKVKRLRFIGHMRRRKEELVHQLLMWEPKQGKTKGGRPVLSYVDQLRKDMGLNVQQLKTVMDNRDTGKMVVNDVRTSSN